MLFLPDNAGSARDYYVGAETFRAHSNVHPIILDLKENRLSCVMKRYRIAVSLIGDIPIPRDFSDFLPSHHIWRDRRKCLQIFGFQAFCGDLMCRAMDRSVDPGQPLAELVVHIVQRTEDPSKKEVPFHVPNGILDLSFCLGTVGFAEPGNEPVVCEEIFEFWVPCVLFWLHCPFEDDLFSVVIEDF